MHRSALALSAAAALTLLSPVARAADPGGPPAGEPAKAPKLVTRVVPPEAQAQPLDVEKATRAYLALLSGPERARSDAYFEGGYWLSLWGFLYGLGLQLLLLATGLSSRMRALAERITGWRWLQPALYWLQYLVAATVIGFPLDVYQGFFREHQYGLSNLSFGGWLGEQGKGFLVGAVLGALGLMALYAVLRRATRTWWIWGAAVGVAFATFAVVIGPVFLEPVFNKFRPLPDGGIRDRILSLARANGIPATDVWEYNASKQSDRVSAHVSGFLGTQRISLNDNLLRRADLPQVEAVMAHEMGHYVLNHVFKFILFFALFLPLTFACAQWAFGRIAARWGARWGVRGVEDPAAWPVLLGLISTVMFLATPLLNTVTRTQEQEADVFGINAAQQPDAFAQVALALSEYRKLDPGPLEEIFFYDHPSGRVRIQTAMKWKAEHLQPLRCGPPGPSAAPPP